jgi:hypothetical protein
MPTYMKATAAKMIEALNSGPKTMFDLQSAVLVSASSPCPSDLAWTRQVFNHLLNAGTIKRTGELAEGKWYLFSL